MLTKLEKTAITFELIDTLEKSCDWCGEPHIQKAVYCLQNITHVPTQFHFILYKHAPFSFNLRTVIHLTPLLTLDFDNPCGPHFTVNDQGRALIQRAAETVEKYRRQIVFVVETFRDKTLAHLERLTTALYIKLNYWAPSVEDKAWCINELKPHIPLDKAFAAVRELEAILKSYKQEFEECAGSLV